MMQILSISFSKLVSARLGRYSEASTATRLNMGLSCCSSPCNLKQWRISIASCHAPVMEKAEHLVGPCSTNCGFLPFSCGSNWKLPALQDAEPFLNPKSFELVEDHLAKLGCSSFLIKSFESRVWDDSPSLR
ncbi:hypothetical protein HPP92_011997 [Vanilla planifolia]|uniref:Uncharacterized protein n=1 Tax=Vanilla planifolia TaxID=51239 RepID=A0A835R2X6_VANPL|nr:hypothetical protein HPP92_011997 [Vanilla planifolia]